MPFNVSWIVAVIAFVLAITVWAKTKRFAPAAGVFIGGILIVAFTDPSILNSASEAAKRLIKQGFDQGLN